MSVEQSIILATRQHPISLTLGFSFVFQDDGAAFMDALQVRRSDFGSLHLRASPCNEDDKICLDYGNLQRLFQTKHIEKVGVKGRLIDNLLPLVLSSPAKIKSWEYSDSEKDQDLRIEPSKLKIVIRYGRHFHGGTILSNLFHFDKLDFTLLDVQAYCSTPTSIPGDLSHQLIDFVAARKNLEGLRWGIPFHSDSLIRNLFSVVGKHKQLRVFLIHVDQCTAHYQDESDHAYELIRTLLQQNRYITVMDRYGKSITDGSSIDRLYFFNSFYRDSESLQQEHHEIRSFLVGSLLKNESIDLQRYAFFLSMHTDTLCELIDGASVKELPTQDNTTHINSHQSLSGKTGIELLPESYIEIPPQSVNGVDHSEVLEEHVTPEKASPVESEIPSESSLDTAKEPGDSVVEACDLKRRVASEPDPIPKRTRS